MLNFTFTQPVNIIYGVGTVAQLGELAKTAGFKKPFVVYDAGVKAAGIIDKVGASLKSEGIDFASFDKVQSDPPVQVVMEGYEAFTKEGCDSVIAVGGGSSIDTAKGVNILRYNEPPILKYADPANEMKRALGLILIPTTSGTGSELSNGLVITDEDGAKVLILNNNGMAEYAIIDPELYVGMPPDLTRYTGVDALAHSVESHMTILSNDLTRQISEKAIELIVKWLPVAAKDGTNIEARSNMAIAATMGGWCLNLAAALGGHAFAHIIGAKFHMPHGAACGYALPYVLEYNATLVPENVKKIASLLGADLTGTETNEELGKKARKAAEKFIFEDVGMKPATVFEYDKSQLSDVAVGISNEICMSLNPAPIPIPFIESALKEIFV